MTKQNIASRPSNVDEEPTYYEKNKTRLKKQSAKYYRKNRVRLNAKSKLRYKMDCGKSSQRTQKRYAEDEEFANNKRLYNRERNRRIRAEKRQQRNNAESK